MSRTENSQVAIKRVASFRIGAAEKKDRVFEEALVDLLLQKPVSVQELHKILSSKDSSHDGVPVLEGRGNIILGNLPEHGPVIVKCYHRGGLLQWFLSNRYVKWGMTRGQAEFEMLVHIRSIGVSAPRPVAFAYAGFPFYRAWLVMSEILGKRSLAQLSRENEDFCHEIVPSFIRQLAVLIRNRILHVDLHPGNVVLDRENRLFILDFDKARKVRWSLNSIRDYYLRRWRRAVIKHGLPDFLSEAVCLGLRQSFEEDSSENPSS